MKLPAAVELGRRGGSANSQAQQEARKRPKAGAGRPRIKARCAQCEASKRTCYHGGRHDVA